MEHLKPVGVYIVGEAENNIFAEILTEKFERNDKEP